MIERTYLSGKKLNGKNIANTEILTTTWTTTLNEAKEINNFKNVLTSDVKTLFKDGSGNTSLFYE